MSNRMNKRQRAHNYRKGDVVMLRRHERVMGKEIGKFEDEYTGPYIIESKNRTGAITLVNPLGVPLNRLVRPNQLKFVSHNTAAYKQDTFVVDSIVDHRGEGENREYKVHWEGYDSDHDTWEPISSLFDCEFAIKEYLYLLAAMQIGRRREVYKTQNHGKTSLKK